jgi:4-alpha-glucanotransferase
MLTERAAGILLHPTSIPTRFGVGDLGPGAYRFADWLALAGQRYWQVLPLCPADCGGSPYQSASSFAGNPLLISPELLARDGLLTDDELADAALPKIEAGNRVDFGQATAGKSKLLELAVRRFQSRATGGQHDQFHRFVEEHCDWVQGHALFMAAREANHGLPWRQWSIHTALQPPVIPAELAARFTDHLVLQYLFFSQWQSLRAYARERGIRIIGDIPIYVSHDSADVWANRHLFQLDDQGNSIRVAGVPPDYFAATGQLWNNPLYDWQAMEAEGFDWWIRRLKASLALVDMVRLDHFRGFEAFWSVPAGEPTAMNGEWVPGPRDKLMTAFNNALHPQATGSGNVPDVPIIAEDLGMITEEVHAFRKRFCLPGMKVLQFMLPGEAWDHTGPDDFEPNSVVYTGTHDNDTSLGWFREKMLPHPELLDRLRRYVRCDESQFAWEFIEYAWRCGSNLAIAPLQDVLSLDASARMNTPGTSGDQTTNWQWKFTADMLHGDHHERLRELTRSSGRGGFAP